jgi:hypothetical protein
MTDMHHSPLGGDIILTNKYGRWRSTPANLDLVMDKMLPASVKQLRQYFVHEVCGGDTERGQYTDIAELSALLVMIADCRPDGMIAEMQRPRWGQWEEHWDRLDAERAEIYAQEDAIAERDRKQAIWRGVPHPYVGDTIWECQTCGLTDRAWEWFGAPGETKYWVHPETPGDPNEYREEDDDRQ